MALGLPSLVKKLRLPDEATQRAFDFVTTAANGLLNTLAAVFTFGDNLLTILKPVQLTTLTTTTANVTTANVTNLTATGTVTAPTVTAGNGVYQALWIHAPDSTSGITASATNNTAINGESSVVIPFNCSIAAITAKVYATPLSLGTIFFSAGPVGGPYATGPFLTTSINSGSITFARGAWNLTAGQTLSLVYTSSATYSKTGGGFQIAVWVYQ